MTRPPDQSVDDAKARALLAQVLDDAATTEVRCAALDTLAAAQRVEVVPELRRLRARVDAMSSAPYGLDDRLVATCARLGDVEALGAVLALRYNAWRHRRELGDAALGALEAAVGRDALARAVGAADAAPAALAQLVREHASRDVRRWALDSAPDDTELLAAGLRDPEWLVAEGAQARLLGASVAVEAPLAAIAADAGLAAIVRARALLVLLQRGRRDLALPAWASLPDRHLPLPDISAPVRRAILRHHLPGERGTDPRLQLEASLELGVDLATGEPAEPGESAEQILTAAREALRSAGIEAGAAVEVGEARRQGSGTFVLLDVAGGVLELSELGRFVSQENDLPQGQAAARAALEGAGFRFIEGAETRAYFQGLRIYFFGDRDALRVYDLLFYWQD